MHLGSASKMAQIFSPGASRKYDGGTSFTGWREEQEMRSIPPPKRCSFHVHWLCPWVRMGRTLSFAPWFLRSVLQAWPEVSLSAQSLSGPPDTTDTASPGAAQPLTISVEVSYLPGEAAAVVPAPPRADGAGGHTQLVCVRLPSAWGFLLLCVSQSCPLRGALARPFSVMPCQSFCVCQDSAFSERTEAHVALCCWAGQAGRRPSSPLFLKTT